MNRKEILRRLDRETIESIPMERIFPNTTEEVTFDIESESVCNELRQTRLDGLTYMQISDKFDIDPYKVTYHVRGQCSCSCETEALTSDKHRPWVEEDLLRAVLEPQQHNLHYTQAGEAFDGHQQTVKNWANKYDIEDRSVSSKIVRITESGHAHRPDNYLQNSQA